MGALILPRLATGLCRRLHKLATRKQVHGHEYHAFLSYSITYILTRWYDMANPAALSLCPLGAQDDDGKLNSYVERECDLKRHIPHRSERR